MIEWGCIGFLAGAIVCLVFFGMGVCYGGSDPEQSDDDSDVHLYVFSRHRDRSRDQRDNPPDAEEIIDVLYTLRIAASHREKRVLDYLIDKEESNERKTMDN